MYPVSLKVNNARYAVRLVVRAFGNKNVKCKA